MSQIMYNYPAMLSHAGEMSSYAGALHAVGAEVAAEQAALEELERAYRAMASTHEMNTTSMAARDQAEGAKWG